MPTTLSVATVNAVPLHRPDETLGADALRQRACMELLRQAAIQAGLLPADDPPPADGATSVAASTAIEVLLERELPQAEPSDETCHRYFEANRRRYASGERVRARHILFAVTPGVDLTALRARAEACLIELRCEPSGMSGTTQATEMTDTTDGRFAHAAAQLSNCPSGAAGGALGWLAATDCAPEFARALFGHATVGVLPQIVHSRFGLHVVEVLEREPGVEPDYDAVRGSVAQTLRQQTFAAALRQYLRLLAGNARIDGVVLDTSATPLVQ